MKRLSRETDVEYIVLNAIQEASSENDAEVGAMTGAILELILKEYIDFDTNLVHKIVEPLFAHGLIMFASNKTRGLKLTEQGREKWVKGPAI